MNFLQKCVMVVAAVACLDTEAALSCSYTDIMACSSDLTSTLARNVTDLNAICKALTGTLDCFKTLSVTCPASIRSLIDTAQAQYTNVQAMCQSPSGGESLCSTEDVTACLSEIQNMSDETARDLSKVCPLSLAAIDCLNDEIETCPEYLQSQIKKRTGDMALTKGLCDHYSTNPDPDSSTCSLTRIQNCSLPLMKDGVTAGGDVDMKTMCPKLVNAAGCLSREIAGCPESLKTQLQSQLDGMQQFLGMCQLVGGGSSTNPDPGEGGSGGGSSECSMTQIMGCLGPLQAVPLDQTKDLDHVCPVTLKALKCLDTKMAPCPASVSAIPSLATAKAQLQQGKSFCHDNWTGGGTGLHSSVLLTLTTATLAMLRHFL